jgi:hypothetical protein
VASYWRHLVGLNHSSKLQSAYRARSCMCGLFDVDCNRRMIEGLDLAAPDFPLALDKRGRSVQLDLAEFFRIRNGISKVRDRSEAERDVL